MFEIFQRALGCMKVLEVFEQICFILMRFAGLFPPFLQALFNIIKISGHEGELDKNME